MKLRYGGQLSQMIHRLSEFYDFEDLNYFMVSVKQAGYTQSDAMRWLDLKVREDYVESGGLERDVIDYVIEYLR